MNSNQNSKAVMNSDMISGSYFGIPALPEEVRTTMAYIPFQTDTTHYTPEAALKYGTLFADLNKPFKGGRCE